MRSLIVFCLLIFISPLAFCQPIIDSLKTIEIHGEKAGSFEESNGAKLKQVLNSNEFKKAACCTLSESFELSNTVEISNADGVSGIRQIEMMGLNGKYALMTRDNIPQLAGLATLNGLNNIPGPMVSEVRLAKGTGSVTLGYEGLTGGIDYALKSAITDPKWQFNAYQNNQGRSEINIVQKSNVSSKLTSHSFFHLGKQWYPTDMNNDGYSDMPQTSRIFVGNQTNYQGKNVEGQFGATYWKEQKDAGSMAVGSNQFDNTFNNFHFVQNENRIDVFAKLGIILDSTSSIGNIINVSNHQNRTLLNFSIDRNYVGKESKISYSGVYENQINKLFKIKTGISAMVNQFNEVLSDNLFATSASLKYQFSEKQIGAFGELVVTGKKVSLVLGLREDYHNAYGFFFTPRMHSKIEFNKNNKLFLQAGLGRRTSYALIENLPLFISNKEILISTNNPALPYGLAQEQGFNLGISYLKNFFFLNYPSTLTVDVFSTRFMQQTVIDRDVSLQQTLIQSYGGQFAGTTNSIHAEWTIHPIRRMEVKLAYRYAKNLQWLNNKFQISPFQSVHRGLLVIGYKTRNKWHFDGVAQINGPKRIAYFSETENKYSPSFVIANFQIRKAYDNSFEFYVGIENIGNVKQSDPILSIKNSQGEIFDAANSWAPANGINFYTGIRFSIK